MCNCEEIKKLRGDSKDIAEAKSLKDDECAAIHNELIESNREKNSALQTLLAITKDNGINSEVVLACKRVVDASAIAITKREREDSCLKELDALSSRASVIVLKIRALKEDRIQ